MDNYEYRMRTDEMRSFAEAGEYDKAMEIANQIDWRRVKSVPMLCLVSEIYENMKSYQISRDILFLAYDRQPTGRKIVYRLGILAIKIGDFNEAKDCYEEFIRLAPRDPNQFILRYRTLKAMDAPVEEQIDALRAFKKSEYVEKWAYELAILYQKANMIKECIAECDDLILWFSEGRYVYKAMELKMRYKPLSEEQQAKFDKRFEREETPVRKPLLKHEAAQRLFTEKVLSPATKDTKPINIGVAPADAVSAVETGIKKEKFDGGITGTMKIEEILADWEKTRSEIKTEIDKAVEGAEDSAGTKENSKEEKIQMLSEDIRRLLDDLEAEERGEDVTFQDEISSEVDVVSDEEESLAELEIISEPEEEQFPDADEESDASETVCDTDLEEKDEEISEETVEEIEEPEKEECSGKTMIYTSPKQAESLQEETESVEEVVYRDPDYKVPDAERLSLRMTDAIDFDTDDERLRKIYAESVIVPEEGMEKEVIYRSPDYKIPDEDVLSLTLAEAIDFDEYDEALREEFVAEKGETKLFEAQKENLVLKMEDAEDTEDAKDPILRMEDAEDMDEAEGNEKEDTFFALDDVDSDSEAIEEVEEEKRIIRKSPGGVVLDTAFKVQGRYDLSATSVIGTKAGLTAAQKKIFSYFVPIRGMSSQLYKVLENDKNNDTRYGTSRSGNILIAGDKGNGKTVLAVNIMKAIQKNRGNEKASAAIIKADALNTKDVAEIISKLSAGGLIIEKASLMDKRTAADLNRALEGQTGELIVVLEDEKRPLEQLLHKYPVLQRKFTSKVSIPTLINDELVTFAQTYAEESGCRIDEMGILALYSCIDSLQTEDHFVTVTEVKELMDSAIARARHGGVKQFFTTALKNENGEIIIKEEHLKK